MGLGFLYDNVNSTLGDKICLYIAGRRCCGIASEKLFSIFNYNLYLLTHIDSRIGF